MDKRKIANHNWICRTLTGTIALEESSMPLKQRNFLKLLSKPVVVSKLYKTLKDKYPNDYSTTNDFVEIMDFTHKKLWIDKVEEPQLIDNNKKEDISVDKTFDDSKESISLPEEIMNLSRKAQSSYNSEESIIYSLEIEKPQEKSNEQEKLKSWFEEQDVDYNNQQDVEFVPDQKEKELILKLGLGSINNMDDDSLEIPEEDPFFLHKEQDQNIPRTQAANQILNILDTFDGYDDEEDHIKSENMENEKEFIVEEKVVEKTEITEVSTVKSTVEDREIKRQERLSKRNVSTSKTSTTTVSEKKSKKEGGIFGSIKDGFKKIIGK